MASLHHTCIISSLLYIFMHKVQLALHSSSVMDCQVIARGSIPGWNGVKTVLHVFRKGQ